MLGENGIIATLLLVYMLVSMCFDNVNIEIGRMYIKKHSK